jgi:FKBP-type peptidyl-prolyl cis-trans isomerase FkpA
MNTRALVFVLLLGAAACGGNEQTTAGAKAYVAPTPHAYEITDLVVGSGRSPRKGDVITVNYTGWLYDPTKPDSKGAQFDSSLDAGRTPFTFTLRAEEVIPGWDMGFDTMKLGGKRRLIIPPHLAYGHEGTPGGPIPPEATLVFEMQLVDIKTTR